MKKSLIVVAATLLASACIVGESTHTLYISPEGGVTWVVHERELRSTSGPEEYKAEEAGFLADALVGLHPVARAFALLAPTRVDDKVLRAERPYEIRTEARFRSIEELAADLLRQLGFDGAASLRFEDGVTELEIVVDNPCEESDLADDGILELVDELSSYRLLVTEGRFVDAVGFELLEEGAVAVPLAVEVDCESPPAVPLVLSLSWEGRTDSEQLR